MQTIYPPSYTCAYTQNWVKERPRRIHKIHSNRFFIIIIFLFYFRRDDSLRYYYNFLRFCLLFFSTPPLGSFPPQKRGSFVTPFLSRM